ncbi:MAG TPA: hypothetical protein VHY08_13270 [Bacillota bacterium]|nr:hypothetical protein [Bacillota bacterium]
MLVHKLNRGFTHPLGPNIHPAFHPRLIPFLLLFTLLLVGTADVRGQTEKSLLNTPEAKYYLVNQHLDHYQIANKNQIYNDQGLIYTSPPGFEIRSFDLISDQGSMLLGILMDNGKTCLLAIYEETPKTTLLIKNMTSYQPWKIQFAEVDGDGKIEVCLGVFKESPLHPVLAKRLFIYNFDHDLRPKWRGSRLSKPLVDFFFFTNHKQETYLISTEITRDNQQCLNAYFWDQFGFTGFGDPYTLAAGQTLSEGYLKANNKLTHRLLLIKDEQVEGKIPEKLWGGIVDE